MMKRFSLALFIGIYAGSIFASTETVPEKPWPVGKWNLCEDPDQSPKDSMQFNADGTGLVIRAKGNIEFIYKYAEQSVSMLANVNGRAIPFELKVSSDHKMLMTYSDKTGNTAIYVLTEGPAARTCSIQ